MFSAQTFNPWKCGWFSKVEYLKKGAFVCIDECDKKILVTKLNSSPYEVPYEKDTDSYESAKFIGYVKLMK